MGKIVLGYWDLRGRGAAVRMMLEYGGLDWQDKKYQITEKPDGGMDMSDWQNVKYKLGLDFPNLPYLIDGNVKLTETWAILRYVGKKIGLAPSTEKAKCEADMLQGVLESFMMGLVGILFSPNFEELKEPTREKQEAKLAELEKFLQGRNFLTGPKLCFVDFAFFQSLDFHRHFYAGILDEYPNVKGYLRRFHSDKRIAAFMMSPSYYVFPMFAPMAKWGGKSPSTLKADFVHDILIDAYLLNGAHYLCIWRRFKTIAEI